MDGALRAALIAQHSVGVALCDAEGVLIEYNAVLAEMVGMPYRRSSAEEWPTCYFLYDACGERPLRPDEVPLARALGGEQVVDQIIATRIPGNGTRFLRCTCSQLVDDRGRIAGAVFFGVDATETVVERRRIEALRDRLVDTINHELRTPTAALKGHIELLCEVQEQLPAEAAWSVDVLARNLERMQEILDRISALAEEATTEPDPDRLGAD